MSNIRKPARLTWQCAGIENRVYGIGLIDPEAPEYHMPLVPEDMPPFSWPSPEEARVAAAAALRDLADRIERGEP